MGFIKKLAQFLSPPRQSSSPANWIAVKCNRCGEVIRARINLYNDLSIEYTEGSGTLYHCRKVLVGEGHCFQRIEVWLTFDAERRLTEHQVNGGTWLEE